MAMPHITTRQYINSILVHYTESQKFQHALRYAITIPVFTTLRHGSDGKHYTTSWQ